LEGIFALLPEAGMCFDIAHARQVDPTMSQAYLILQRFGSRVRQVHMSEVDQMGRHTRLTLAATFAFPRVLPLLPPNVPIILESPVDQEEIRDEIEFAAALFRRGQSEHRSAY
jgi:hypothetical protein